MNLSITNCNNMTISTSVVLVVQGITSNYWFNRMTKKSCYMEVPVFLYCSNILDHAKKKDLTTALLTSK